MRRKRLLLAAVASLAALSGLVAAALQPGLRARYQLRFASPRDVKVLAWDERVLTGNARGFARSAGARALLPDLLELALAEAERDDGVCYRELVFEVTTGALPRPESSLAWDKTGEGAGGPGGEPAPPERSEVLHAKVACLRSRESVLRVWALAHLPLDARLVEAVSTHFAWVGAHLPEKVVNEEFELWRWLREFAFANQKLVQQEGLVNPWGRHFADDAWSCLLPDSRATPSRKVRYGERPNLAELSHRLLEWTEKYRSKLPEQIR